MITIHLPACLLYILACISIVLTMSILKIFETKSFNSW